MTKSVESGMPKTGRIKQKIWMAHPSARCLLSAFFLLVAGCTGVSRPDANTTDPLLGGRPVARPASYTAPGPQASSVPPLTAPYSTTSTAALASGVRQPLDPNHDIGIAAQDHQAERDPWHGPANTSNPANAPSHAGVVLSGPQPAGERWTQAEPPPSPSSPLAAQLTSTTQPGEFAPLVWQRVGSAPDGSGLQEFRCVIPDAQNPNMQRHITVRAADLNGALKAMMEAVEKHQRETRRE
jgi:hypothetical protein